MSKDKFCENGWAIDRCKVRVFYFDPSNGEYIGTRIEDIPAGVGIPAYSTLTPPLENKPGFASVYVGPNKWEYIVDHRGKTIYNKITKERHTLMTLGEISDQATFEVPPNSACRWDGEKWERDTDKEEQQRVASACNERLTLLEEAKSMLQPFTWALEGGYATDVDKQNIANIQKYIYDLTKLVPKKGVETVFPETPRMILEEFVPPEPDVLDFDYPSDPLAGKEGAFVPTISRPAEPIEEEDDQAQSESD